MNHPNETIIMLNLYGFIEKKICSWVGETINSDEYAQKMVIDNWVCLYEQMIAEKIVQGKMVHFE